MKPILSLFIALLLSSAVANAQNFLPAFQHFSGKKPSYLILESGERVDFTVRKIKRKKGLIKWVKVRTLNDRKKAKYWASDVRELAVAPSNFAKMQAFRDGIESVMEKSKMNMSSYGELAHFYQETTTKGGRTRLYQICNPGFDQKIRVYNDPRSKETSGVRAHGIKLTGGLDKSYYVKTGDAFIKLHKRNYSRWYTEQFSDCEAMKTKYPKGGAWRDFNNHITFYDKNCQVAAVSGK